jgi:tRNA pseudouridine55 synthase
MAPLGRSGFLVLDKPAGLTSRAAVDHAQRWFPKEKLGHAGTLDPAATGVLVVAIGSPATRLLEYIQLQKKVYRATFELGASSTTDDADGVITRRKVFCAPPEAKIRTLMQDFVGTIEQVPPAYSAALVAGRRAHALARRGEAVQLQPRAVTIDAFQLERYAYPLLEVEVQCGKGTYIRSLARDLGKALGIGGYVASLRRTRIGPFTCERAISWDADSSSAQTALLPLWLAVEGLPQVQVSAAEAVRLAMGQRIPWTIPSQSNTGLLTLLSEQGELIGIGRMDPSSHSLIPEKMFQQIDRPEKMGP